MGASGRRIASEIDILIYVRHLGVAGKCLVIALTVQSGRVSPLTPSVRR